MIEHIIQETKQDCAVASATMMLKFYGHNVTYQEVKSSLCITSQGVVFFDLLIYLKQFGDFEGYKLDDEKELLNALPAIVLIKNHFMVVWAIKDGMVYFSDPGTTKIKKMSQKKFSKLGAIKGLISGGKKEVELSELKPTKLKWKLKKYSIPYCFLLILEMFLLTFSMFYLFSIEDFTAFKIGFFLSVIFLTCFIALLKNYYITQIQTKLDQEIVDKTIVYTIVNPQIDILTLKKTVNNAYQLKYYIFSFLSSLIPSLVLVALSVLTFLLIDVFLAIMMGVIFAVIFAFHYFLNKKKNQKLYAAKIEELEFNAAWEINHLNPTSELQEEIIARLKKVKEQMIQFSKIEQTATMISAMIRQTLLMFVLIYCYSFDLDQYVIFIVAFLFYAFDGLVSISDYCSTHLEHKLIRQSFAKLKKSIDG